MKEKVVLLSIGRSSTTRNSVRITGKKVSKMKDEIRQYYDNNGYLSWSERRAKYVILGTNMPANGLVECPQCKIGMIVVIRSRQTRKRFLGCSNYHNGCRASSPLVQRGMLHPTKTPCRVCFWPMIMLRYSIKQKWAKQCGNIRCPAKPIKS